jgi:peroxiredoxin
MAMTSSFQLQPGAAAPDFDLADVVDPERVVRRIDLAGQPLLVMFLCAHCPYVQHVEEELARIGRDYAASVAIVAIASNDPERYPQDAPAGLREQAIRAGFAFPYLFDDTQQVARAYGAACTPDVFLFDARHRLAYRGRIDATRPGAGTPAHGADLRAALDAVLARRPVPGEQHPSIGCGIKWRPDHAPIGKG